MKLWWRRSKKDKYAIKDNLWYEGWFAIVQVSNNVIVAYFSDKAMAQLVLEYLNALPGSITGYLKHPPRKD